MVYVFTSISSLSAKWSFTQLPLRLCFCTYCFVGWTSSEVMEIRNTTPLSDILESVPIPGTFSL